MGFRFHNNKSLGEQAVELLRKEADKAYQCLDGYEAAPTAAARRTTPASKPAANAVKTANGRSVQLRPERDETVMRMATANGTSGTSTQPAILNPLGRLTCNRSDM